MTEEERMNLETMKTQKMNIDIVVNMLADWFECFAFNPGIRDASIRQMIDTNQWDLICALYTREPLDTFREVVSGNFTLKFLVWVSVYSVEYLETLLTEYPLFIDMIKRAMSTKYTRHDIFDYICSYDYDVEGVYGEYTTQKTNRPIWTKECTEKVMSIKCINNVFTDKLIKELEGEWFTKTHKMNSTCSMV